jgi:hypothetical protein
LGYKSAQSKAIEMRECKITPGHKRKPWIVKEIPTHASRIAMPIKSKEP